jgi:hypothetical protein
VRAAATVRVRTEHISGAVVVITVAAGRFGQHGKGGDRSGEPAGYEQTVMGEIAMRVATGHGACMHVNNAACSVAGHSC